VFAAKIFAEIDSIVGIAPVINTAGFYHNDYDDDK